MHIISDFRDYYDIGMQNGVDLKLPYRRFYREEPVQIQMNERGWYTWWYYSTKYIILFFGFAGTIYPAIVRSLDSDRNFLYYDLAELDDVYYESQMQQGWQKSRREKEKKKEQAKIREELEEIWSFKDRKDLLHLFEKFKTAIFLYRLGAECAIINPRLNLYGFQKILPPMEAYQELEMYVGSYLTQPVIEEPPISDKIKAEIHGFGKYSFRKDKDKN